MPTALSCSDGGSDKRDSLSLSTVRNIAPDEELFPSSSLDYSRNSLARRLTVVVEDVPKTAMSESEDSARWEGWRDAPHPLKPSPSP